MEGRFSLFLTLNKRLSLAMSKPATQLLRPTTACLLLVLFGFGVHTPALHGAYVWDDQSLIAGNPLIKSPLLLAENFRFFLFADGFSSHYRPVQSISLLVDYVIWHNNTLGFHLTNILLHIGSALLLYLLLRRVLPLLFIRVEWQHRDSFLGASPLLIALV